MEEELDRGSIIGFVSLCSLPYHPDWGSILDSRLGPGWGLSSWLRVLTGFKVGTRLRPSIWLRVLTGLKAKWSMFLTLLSWLRVHTGLKVGTRLRPSIWLRVHTGLKVGTRLRPSIWLRVLTGLKVGTRLRPSIWLRVLTGLKAKWPQSLIDIRDTGAIYGKSLTFE